MLGGAACMENPDQYSTGGSQSPESSGSLEVPAKSDREIVEAVWNEIQRTDSVWDGEGINYIGEDMKLAEALSGKLFGSITSEEDAKEKAIATWIELGTMSIRQPINATLYEEYDAWLLWESSPPSPPYTMPDGREYPPSP